MFPRHRGRFPNPYFSLESFDFICPPAFSHLPLSVSPFSLLSFIRSESTSSSLSLFFRSYSIVGNVGRNRKHNDLLQNPNNNMIPVKLFQWWRNRPTLILMSLSDSFFCFSASFLLRLSSSRRFLFSSSLCRFFSSSLLLLSSLFSSLILCKERYIAWGRFFKCFKAMSSYFLHILTFFHSYLFLNFLIFYVLQQRCCPFGWNHTNTEWSRQMLTLAAASIHLNLET